MSKGGFNTGFSFMGAFGREKPHSSVTDWVEIMTSSQTEEESFEGMPELVDAINLQASGPQEAARALRKKMKHAGPHQQYRAIVIMRLLLDNIPEKMKGAFSEPQFLDVIKSIWHDAYIDKRVKKRLSTILVAWQEQFKGDPSMSVFAGLYGQLKGQKSLFQDEEVLNYLGHTTESAKLARAREAKEKKDREREERRRREREGGGESRRRRSFNFERDKVKVTSSIVDASQASSNLLNAIMRVNLDVDTFEGNEEVQMWLTRAKAAKKVIMRYTQLVEDEELIGTLIETHERLEAALNTYQQLVTPEDPAALSSGVANISLTDQELRQIQADNDAAVQRAQEIDAASNHGPSQDSANKAKRQSNNPYDTFLHPDLADLDFNAAAPQNLQPPMRPTSAGANRDTGGGATSEDRRGSLSDYSDYESSDEETFISPPKKNKTYVTLSDDSDTERPPAVPPGLGQTKSNAASSSTNTTPATTKADHDPFADPFA